MQKQLAACGVKPQVVSDIADLQPLLERDGAAVIDGPECDAEATRALARQIFAEKDFGDTRCCKGLRGRRI